MILDEATRTLRWRGRVHDLTPVQYRIVAELLEHWSDSAGGVLTATELARRVFGGAYAEGEAGRNNLRVQLSLIRKRVPGLIASEHTAVYRLTPETRVGRAA